MMKSRKWLQQSPSLSQLHTTVAHNFKTNYLKLKGCDSGLIGAKNKAVVKRNINFRWFCILKLIKHLHTETHQSPRTRQIGQY